MRMTWLSFPFQIENNRRSPVREFCRGCGRRPAERVRYRGSRSLSPLLRLAVLGFASFFIGWDVSGNAAEVSMDIQPRVVALGEAAIWEIAVHNAPQARTPQPPEIEGFDVVPAGTQQNIQFINGRQSISVVFRYQLIPRAVGEYQIGPFQYELGGQVFDLPAISVKVVPARGSEASRVEDLIFATLTVTRTNLYVQEVFDLTLAIYYTPDLSLDRSVNLLDFDTVGLSIGRFEELGTSREAVGGRVYNVWRYRARVVALAAGEYHVEPRVRVNFLVRRGRDPFFDSFFGDRFFPSFFERVETRPHTFSARPLVLRVSNLPAEGRPADFGGAVGQYEFRMSYRPERVKAGEPVTFRYEITGRGNFDTVRSPVVAAADAIRVFDPQLVEQKRGVKVFEQLVIPRHAGRLELPEVVFSFFDPENGQYISLRQGPILVDVAPGEALATSDTDGRTASAPRDTLGQDLVYLKPPPRRPVVFIDIEHVPPSVHLFPAGAMAVAYIVARRRRRLERDPKWRARRQAPALIKADIAEARRLRHDPLRAAEALQRAANRFFSVYLDLLPGEITAQQVSDRLKRAGLPEEVIVEMASLLEFCERLRFAGSSSISQNDRAELERRIQRLPRLLKACRRAVK